MIRVYYPKMDIIVSIISIPVTTTSPKWAIPLAVYPKLSQLINPLQANPFILEM